MATNTFYTTSFVARALGTYLVNNSAFIGYSYQGINEFTNSDGRAPGQSVEIKLPGYPTVQLGLSVTAEDIVDRIISYLITNNDIYNVTREINFQSIGLNIVGNRAAFISNPYLDPDNKQAMNPQAQQLIDNYAIPAGRVLEAKIETVISEKIRTAAFYTPIDSNSKIQPVDSYAAISNVRKLMNQLGFMKAQRCAFMNNDDYDLVASSLQNMFNQDINKKITNTGEYMEKGLADFKFKECNTIAPTPESPQYAANPDSTGVQVASIAADGSTITFSGVISTVSTVFNAGTKISIPAVKPINKITKLSYKTNLVICVKEEALGDGAGNVTVTLSEPLVAVGDQANVNVLPAASDAAEVFQGHNNNYFAIPMGIIANPVPLGVIHSADQSNYRKDKMAISAYIQGLVQNGVNTYRMSCQMPTLAIPSYLMFLPSPLT